MRTGCATSATRPIRCSSRRDCGISCNVDQYHRGKHMPQVAPAFQMLAGSISPSHAFVHVVDFGLNVNIHGMAVRSSDLIHADRHGAVVVPIETIDPMKAPAPGRAAK